MPTTIDDLASSLQQFFASRFPLGGDGGAGSMLLVFDPLGFPLSIREFAGSGATLAGDLLAHQRAAELADQLPAAGPLLTGTYLPRGGSKLSRWYHGIVDGSSGPSAADADRRAAFEAAKLEALRALSNNELVVVSSPDGSTVPAGTDDRYYATSMTPVDWFAEDSDVWQMYKVDAADDPPPQENPPWYAPRPPIWYREIPVPGDDRFPGPDHLPVHAPTHPELTDYVRLATESELQVGIEQENHVLAHPWTLDHDRLLTARPTIGSRVQLQVQPVNPIGNGSRSRLLTTVLTDVPLADVLTENPILTHPWADRWNPSSAQVIGGLSVSDAILASTTSTRPSSSKFSVRFDYCVVRFDRPWWDDMFLSRRDWQLAGYQAGELCSGAAGQPKDPLTMVTVGMLVVRNLAISANWSQADLAMLPRSTSLGPFCIAASTFDAASGALTRKGHQVIAWLCQVPPALPPL
ncbi:hypothetical protein NKI77_07895 [Mesorhizobium opportunistum]|uniref:Uncharacterized protein n=1 Tax=Mesorhizobium opportunistum TaxID=593909 RepID=A0ABV1YBJ3_9HYPH|nr:hypothetical protein [Mesorhizobium sp.]TIN94365.1 MAG: hypothetical protein E5Y06_16640 [Mesorhizobium sp.]TJU96121.1 MAG: hypothetical protein E5Y08_23530 [Mesorhizobium sp.]TJV16287.1 MAG: hypothetical protein E5Y07_17910 [Mesorhizobium sp.]